MVRFSPVKGITVTFEPKISSLKAMSLISLQEKISKLVAKPSLVNSQRKIRLLLTVMLSGNNVTAGFFCTAIYWINSPVVSMSIILSWIFSTILGSCSSCRNLSKLIFLFFNVQLLFEKHVIARRYDEAICVFPYHSFTSFSYKSSQLGFSSSINLIFWCLLPPFSLFSSDMVSSIFGKKR